MLHHVRPRFDPVIRRLPRRKPKPKPFTMFDSVNVDMIPRGAVAVAGYVGGNWATFPTLEERFPNARRLSIAVSSSEDAMCLDVERGDAVNADAPSWVRRQQKRGLERPWVYTSVSNAWALLSMLRRFGIRRKNVKLFTAHYTGRPHRCWLQCGLWTRADATQWTDKAGGKNLDASYCAPDFLP